MKKSKFMNQIHNLNGQINRTLNRNPMIVSLDHVNRIILQIITAKQFKIKYQNNDLLRLATPLGEIICYLAGYGIRIIGFYDSLIEFNGGERYGR
jgi:hypothetical protein